MHRLTSNRHCELTTGRAADLPSMKPPPERFPGEKPGSMYPPAERFEGWAPAFAGEAFYCVVSLKPSCFFLATAKQSRAAEDSMDRDCFIAHGAPRNDGTNLINLL
jgi:hypothetical protein